ncbi:hypothetical protein Droror1_Dr00027635 [Drosera rotundifolia]
MGLLQRCRGRPGKIGRRSGKPGEVKGDESVERVMSNPNEGGRIQSSLVVFGIGEGQQWSGHAESGSEMTDLRLPEELTCLGFDSVSSSLLEVLLLKVFGVFE